MTSILTLGSVVSWLAGDSYSTRYPYKIIVLSFNSNTTGATRGAGNSFSYLEFSVGFGLPILQFSVYGHHNTKLKT
jgi:hypothetical protein